MQLVENLVVAQRFRLARELGRGGMGSVWLAHHIELDIPCALKFIDHQDANRPEVRERFAREARAAAQLRSPNVVQILDHGVWEELPYIAMELLEGEDLAQRLRRVGRLSPEECVSFMSQVARALNKAHGQGIVHRDLKPENIFIVQDDEREVLKILDFGIAKVSQNALGPSSNTRTGVLLGTPYYMSPEQAQGVKAIDFRSDLWSFAVIIFECVTGQRPFESEALGDLLIRIMAQPLPVPSQVNPVLPPAFDAWWAQAASRDPQQRFANARAMVEALAFAVGIHTPSAAALQMRASMPNMAAIGTPTLGGPGGDFVAMPPKPPAVTTGSGATRTVAFLQSGAEIRRSPSMLLRATAVVVGLCLVMGGGAAIWAWRSHGTGAASAASSDGVTLPKASEPPAAISVAPASSRPEISALQPVVESPGSVASADAIRLSGKNKGPLASPIRKGSHERPSGTSTGAPSPPAGGKKVDVGF